MKKKIENKYIVVLSFGV